MPLLLLGLSVVLSTGRNLFSKKLSDIRFGTRAFFLCQSVLFLCGAVSLVLFVFIENMLNAANIPIARAS